MLSKERKKELRRIYEEKIGREYVKELDWAYIFTTAQKKKRIPKSYFRK
jgi:hypothetical protein